MTRDQLEHAIRAACDVADDTELFVFGPQSILGEHPDAPPALRASIEVDVQPALPEQLEPRVRSEVIRLRHPERLQPIKPRPLGAPRVAREVRRGHDEVGSGEVHASLADRVGRQDGAGGGGAPVFS